jgi:H+-translocating NAD(P) transhydrogenase subunit alpha
MATLFVPRERLAGERRVAATPASVRRFVDAGVDILVEKDAGSAARFLDEEYEEAGATIASDVQPWSEADLVCTVSPPREEDAARLGEGAVLVGLLAPHHNHDLVRTLVERKVTSLSLELVPRISRAQPMDALSSQANVAGYRAVILAAYLLDKHFPLSMTAAGTIRPATVVVLGAGVAGLQAIATAKRLGAVVRANDIREAARAEVESLGADFIDLEEEADAEAETGYAKEVGEDFLAMQRRVLGRHLSEAHAVITTAFVPGKPAPVLVTEDMVEGMRPGSVLIDLAASAGGNCVLTPDEGEVDHAGVRIVAAPNLAAQLPHEASTLYARNVWELCRTLLDADAPGEVRVDREDEIIAAALLTADGQVVHEPTAEQLRAGEETQ